MRPQPTRDSFDAIAEQYHRARPSYPPDLITALSTRTGLGPGDRVLEVGPGTGQGTRHLLDSGAHVVAVELGPALSAVLRRELPTDALQVLTADFEQWRLPSSGFDLVASFTAWHWLDPGIRTAKAAAALRTGGYLCTVTTTHIVDEPGDFFDEMQRCYRRWMPADGRRPPTSRSVGDAADEADDSPLFGAAERFRFTQDVEYSAEEFVAVLGTYSNHLALPDRDREELFACLTELMTDRYGGRISKRYLHELRIACRR